MRRWVILGWTLASVGCATRPSLPPANFLPPRLLNRDAVIEALAGRVRDREARVVLWLYVDTMGYPSRIQIRTGTGDSGLDSAAVHVARAMEFEPARRDGRVVPAWVEQPLVFVPAPPSPPAVRGRVEPRLLNDVSIVEELRTTHRGLTGWAQVWVRITTGGQVEDARALAVSDPRLGRPARTIAQRFRFSAARPVLEGGATGDAIATAAQYRIVFGPDGTVRAEIPDLDTADPIALRAANPYDSPPRLHDPDQARATLVRALEEAGRSAAAPRAVLWIFVDATGTPVVVHTRASTGDPRLDAALADAARGLAFDPAESQGVAVGAWLVLPIGSLVG
jgi:TonB family protein